MLLMVLMSMNEAPQPGRYAFIAVIFIAVLIDAVLLARCAQILFMTTATTSARDSTRWRSPPRPDAVRISPRFRAASDRGRHDHFFAEHVGDFHCDRSRAGRRGEFVSGLHVVLLAL